MERPQRELHDALARSAALLPLPLPLIAHPRPAGSLRCRKATQAAAPEVGAAAEAASADGPPPPASSASRPTNEWARNASAVHAMLAIRSKLGHTTPPLASPEAVLPVHAAAKEATAHSAHRKQRRAPLSSLGADEVAKSTGHPAAALSSTPHRRLIVCARSSSSSSSTSSRGSSTESSNGDAVASLPLAAALRVPGVRDMLLDLGMVVEEQQASDGTGGVVRGALPPLRLSTEFAAAGDVHATLARMKADQLRRVVLLYRSGGGAMAGRLRDGAWQGPTGEVRPEECTPSAAAQAMLSTLRRDMGASNARPHYHTTLNDLRSLLSAMRTVWAASPSPADSLAETKSDEHHGSQRRQRGRGRRRQRRRWSNHLSARAAGAAGDARNPGCAAPAEYIGALGSPAAIAKAPPSSLASSPSPTELNAARARSPRTEEPPASPASTPEGPLQDQISERLPPPPAAKDGAGERLELSGSTSGEAEYVRPLFHREPFVPPPAARSDGHKPSRVQRPPLSVLADVSQSVADAQPTAPSESLTAAAGPLVLPPISSTRVGRQVKSTTRRPKLRSDVSSGEATTQPGHRGHAERLHSSGPAGEDIRGASPPSAAAAVVQSRIEKYPEQTALAGGSSHQQGGVPGAAADSTLPAKAPLSFFTTSGAAKVAPAAAAAVGGAAGASAARCAAAPLTGAQKLAALNRLQQERDDREAARQVEAQKRASECRGSPVRAPAVETAFTGGSAAFGAKPLRLSSTSQARIATRAGEVLLDEPETGDAVAKRRGKPRGDAQQQPLPAMKSRGEKSEENRKGRSRSVSRHAQGQVDGSADGAVGASQRGTTSPLKKRESVKILQSDDAGGQSPTAGSPRSLSSTASRSNLPRSSGGAGRRAAASPPLPSLSSSSSLRDRANDRRSRTTDAVDFIGADASVSTLDIGANTASDMNNDAVAQFNGLTAADVVCHTRLARCCPPLREIEDRLAAAQANVTAWDPPTKASPKPIAAKLTAVVAAFSSYTDQKVEPIPHAAVCDARAVALYLAALGYRVTTLLGDTVSSIPTKDSVAAAVRNAVATCGTPPVETRPGDGVPSVGADGEPTGVCLVYLAGRGVLSALHGFEGEVFSLLHTDTRLSSLSRHSAVVINELTAIRNTTTNVQPVVMAEVFPVNVALRGVAKANVGERFAVVQCGRRSYGSDMTIRYPRRAGGNAFTWYLLKGLQGDAIRSSHITPALLNAFVKESVERSFDKMLQQQAQQQAQIAQGKADNGRVFDEQEEGAAGPSSAVATEASKWMSSKQSRTAEQELVAKDQQMFHFKKELQARKLMTAMTSCCFAIECLIDVSFRRDIAATTRAIAKALHKHLRGKKKQTDVEGGGGGGGGEEDPLRLVSLLRTGDFRLQLDPEAVGANLSLVVSSGSCDEDVARLVFGTGDSGALLHGSSSGHVDADIHASSSSTAVARFLAQERQEHLSWVQYRLQTSSSQLHISTMPTSSSASFGDSGPAPPVVAQGALYDRLFDAYYRENVRRVNGFNVRQCQERVVLLLEGTQKDFLEVIKHGALGTFANKSSHHMAVLNVEFQQLSPTEEMVQRFVAGTAAAVEEAQLAVKRRVETFEGSPEFARFLQLIHKNVPSASPAFVASSSGAFSKKIAQHLMETADATFPTAKRRKRGAAPTADFIPPGLPAELSDLLHRMVKAQRIHALCLHPPPGVVPPSRRTRRLFDGLHHLQAVARGRALRRRIYPLLECLRSAIADKRSMFERDGVGALDQMKGQLEVTERRRVLVAKEAAVRHETVALWGEIFGEYVGMHVRYVVREEQLLRKRLVVYVEQFERLRVEEQFYRRQYLAIAVALSRLLIGAVTMQHVETEKRRRLFNIEDSDRQKVKTFYQNSFLQLLQQQQARQP